MKNILVLIDFSEMTKPLIEKGAEISAAFSCKLWLIHVMDPDFQGFEVGPQLGCGSRPPPSSYEHTLLNEHVARLQGEGIDAESLIVKGATVQTIFDEAERIGTDLMILGSHGHGALHNMLVGSVSNGILSQATCPLLILPAKSLQK